ncbi:hypothetical protein F5Y13DRAFT_52209 [Hypoxylon sp. FL1857]|nr:hypothetical protein F5Y13DRAFT_52209 [Hypoxylon sp. FL1857]
MPFIEVVFPQLKKDPEVIKEAAEKIPTIAFKAFRDGGVLRALQGFVGTENGKDVTADYKEVIVLEWPRESAFHEFVKSPGYQTLMTTLAPLSTGPAELNLFETNEGAHLLGGGPVLEILLISPKKALSDEEAKSVLSKIQSSVVKNNASGAVYGSSLNLPEKKFSILRAFASKAELEDAKNTSLRQEVLAELSDVAEVTQLVADVKGGPL